MLGDGDGERGPMSEKKKRPTVRTGSPRPISGQPTGEAGCSCCKPLLSLPHLTLPISRSPLTLPSHARDDMGKLDDILQAHVADGQDTTDRLLGAAFAVVDRHGA